MNRFRVRDESLQRWGETGFEFQCNGLIFCLLRVLLLIAISVFRLNETDLNPLKLIRLAQVPDVIASVDLLKRICIKVWESRDGCAGISSGRRLGSH